MEIDFRGLKMGIGELCISNFQQCPSPPPPGAAPRALAFFENKPANAPWRGQTSCSNAPGYREKNKLISKFLGIPSC